MALSDALELNAGGLSLGLAPALGGAITWFRRHAVDLMRPLPPGGGDVGQTACFPLFPYSNRIAGGRFRFDGEDWREPTHPDDAPNPSHGHAYRAAWRVAAADGRTATLTYDHAEGPSPWRYRATQRFVLDPDRLTVILTVVNAGPRAFPFGMGLHPYFPRDALSGLTAALPRHWIGTPRTLPDHAEPTAPELDFSRGRTVAGLDLDDCFSGWDGRAALNFPERGLTLAMEAESVFDVMVVYTPPGADFFCVEPVTNVNNAVNLGARVAGGGAMRVLAPGAALSGAVSFVVGLDDANRSFL